jgi:hypothetical protein
MLRWIALILVASLVLQLFSRQIILLEFRLNQSFISKILCEKRSVPENDCHGKCHLRKQLTKQSEQQKNQKAVSQPTLENFILNETTFNKISIFEPESEKPLIIHINTTPTAGFLNGIFHPPSC